MIKLVNNQGLIEPTSNLEEAFQPYGTPLDTATPKVAPGLVFVYDNAGSVGNDLDFSFDLNPFSDFSFLYNLVYRQAALAYLYTTFESRTGDLLIGYDVAARAGDLEPLYDLRTFVKDSLTFVQDIRTFSVKDYTVSYSGQWASFYIYVEQVNAWEIHPFSSLSFTYSLSAFESKEEPFVYTVKELQPKDISYLYQIRLWTAFPFTYALQPFVDLQSTYDVRLKVDLLYSWHINFFAPLPFSYTLHPFADLVQEYDVRVLQSFELSYDIRVRENLSFTFYIQPFADLWVDYTIHPTKDLESIYSICVDNSLPFEFTLHPFADLPFSQNIWRYRRLDLLDQWEIKLGRDLHPPYTIHPFKDCSPDYHLWNLCGADLAFVYAENLRSSDLLFLFDTNFRLLFSYSWDIAVFCGNDLSVTYSVSPFKDLPAAYGVNPYQDLPFAFRILVKQDLFELYSITRGSKIWDYYNIFNLVSTELPFTFIIQPYADLEIVYDIPLRELSFSYSLNLKQDLAPFYSVFVFVSLPDGFSFRYRILPTRRVFKDILAPYDVSELSPADLLFGYDHAYSNIVEFVREEDFFTQNVLPPYFPERLRYEYAEVAYATQKPALLRMWWRSDVVFWRIDFRLRGEWPYPVPKHFFVDVSDDPFVEEMYETVLEVRPSTIVSESEIRYDVVESTNLTPASILRFEYEIFPQYLLLYRYPTAVSHYDLPEIRTRTIRFRIVGDTSLFDHWVSYPIAFEHFYTLAVMGVVIELRTLGPPYHIQRDNGAFLCYDYSLCITKDLPFAYTSRVIKDLKSTYNIGMVELPFSYDLSFYATLPYSFDVLASPAEDLLMFYGLGVVAKSLLFRYGTKAQAVDLINVYSVGTLVTKDLPFSYFGEKRVADLYYTFKVRMFTADQMLSGLINGKFIQFRFYSVGDL